MNMISFEKGTLIKFIFFNALLKIETLFSFILCKLQTASAFASKTLKETFLGIIVSISKNHNKGQLLAVL